ncbi:hypothetical protein QBC37DRAFT_457518 [Rhypophila decipiens]|uniref:Uncharacterized protein n=1 Tax=Rhypophila decipiens TaxID=261697 RepID=A0AAN6XUC6_9PEZI|nr:hypothetical protein QBC37DRAFT_457518 [Rhypophila decipiens]
MITGTEFECNSPRIPELESNTPLPTELDSQSHFISPTELEASGARYGGQAPAEIMDTRRDTETPLVSPLSSGSVRSINGYQPFPYASPTDVEHGYGSDGAATYHYFPTVPHEQSSVTRDAPCSTDGSGSWDWIPNKLDATPDQYYQMYINDVFHSISSPMFEVSESFRVFPPSSATSSQTSSATESSASNPTNLTDPGHESQPHGLSTKTVIAISVGVSLGVVVLLVLAKVVIPRYYTGKRRKETECDTEGFNGGDGGGRIAELHDQSSTLSPAGLGRSEFDGQYPTMSREKAWDHNTNTWRVMFVLSFLEHQLSMVPQN